MQKKLSARKNICFLINGKTHFERIIAATRRMQNLIDSVSQYAQTSAMDLEFQPIDLNQTAVSCY